MFQIKEQLGAKLKPEELPQINEYAIKLQQLENKVFSTGKDFILSLLSRCISLENELLSRDNDVIEDDSPVLLLRLPENEADIAGDIIDFCEMPGDVDTSTFLHTVYEKLNNPAPIEVEKTIPAQIESHQLLITLTDNPERKREILKEISIRRAKRYKTEPDTIEVLAEKMIFNDNAVFDLGGEFYTGL